MNTELFKKIRDQIVDQPASLDMGAWEHHNDCGTTRCIAGWAIVLTTGKPLYENVRTCLPHKSVYELADQLGIGRSTNGLIPSVAERLLGVNGGQLFYLANDEALAVVELLAEGEAREAEELALGFHVELNLL